MAFFAQRPKAWLVRLQSLCDFTFGNRTIERAGMDLFLSSEVLSHIGEEKSEESDSEGETALGYFDSLLLGKDDVDFICDQGQVKI